MKKLTLVVPVFNEIEVLPKFYERAARVMGDLEARARVKLLFVDDGSTDGSFEALTRLAEKDGRIRVLRLSRNFGSYVALTAGLANADGDAAVVLSADLQDPPELVPELVAKWEAGSDVVWAVRRSRQKDPWLRRMTAGLFYGIFRRIAFPNYPPNGYDFCLVSRAVIEAVTHGQERNTSIFALIVWAGFQSAAVPYDRGERAAGATHWTFGKMFRLAADSIISFSVLPVRLALGAAMLLGVALFCYMGFVIYGTLTGRFHFPPGWPSTMTIILLTSGIQLLVLAVLGEYLWRTLDQTRGRPLYVISRRVGYKDDQA